VTGLAVAASALEHLPLRAGAWLAGELQTIAQHIRA
jgi:hypothetical protein